MPEPCDFDGCDELMHRRVKLRIKMPEGGPQEVPLRCCANHFKILLAGVMEQLGVQLIVSPN